MAEKGVRNVATTLHDLSAQGRRKNVTLGLNLRMSHGFIEVVPDGMPEGCGAPVVLELYEGKLRLLVFGGDENADPLHQIELELPGK